MSALFRYQSSIERKILTTPQSGRRVAAGVGSEVSAAGHRFIANWSHSGLTPRRYGTVPCDGIQQDPTGYVEQQRDEAIGQVGFEPAMCPATRVLRDNRISSLCRDYSDNWVAVSFVERNFQWDLMFNHRC